MKKEIRLGLLAVCVVLCLTAACVRLFGETGKAVDIDEGQRNPTGIPFSCRVQGAYLGSDQSCRSVG